MTRSITAFSDDLAIINIWEKRLHHYSITVLSSINELFSYTNTLLLLDASSCYKDLIQIVYKAQKANIKILLLEENPSFEKGKQALKLGVSGYGDSHMNTIYFNFALETIENGFIWLYPKFTSQLIQGMTQTPSIPSFIEEILSKRELEIALLIKEGHTNKEISTLLDISPHTVKSHSIKIYEKLNIKNRLSLSLFFRNIKKE